MKKAWCCFGGRRGFPTFAVLLLVIAILWLLGDLGVITVSLNWWPIILGIIAIGWIVDHYTQ